MSPQPARRVASIPASPTFAIKAQATARQAAGRDVIDLSVGEPDGEPPVEAVEAAMASLRRGEHRYTPVAGLPELREEIARARREHHPGLEVDPANVLVTHGGKQALAHLALAVLDPGDELIVPTPAWVSYGPQLLIAGAKPVFVRTEPEDGFQPDPERLAAAVTSRTRAILLNSPSNPTGCVVTADRVEAIAELCRQKDLLLISDEIYDRFVYSGPNFRTPVALPGMQERTVVVNAVSKTYAMTGWRVGWLIGPAPIVKAAQVLQSHSTSGVAAVAQRAAIGALRAPESYFEPIQRGLERRRDLLHEGLCALEGVDPGPPPGGAFYSFPRVDGLFGRRTPGGRVLGSAAEVASFFLEEADVAVVPGEGFEEPRCVRMSFAVPVETIETALSRIGDAISRLS